MTLTELMEIVAERTGAEPVVVHGFLQSFVDVIIERLDAGDEVKIRGLGTFKWVDVPEMKMVHSSPGVFSSPDVFTKVAGGRKLKFFPAGQFKNRRTEDVERRRRNDQTRSGAG